MALEAVGRSMQTYPGPLGKPDMRSDGDMILYDSRAADIWYTTAVCGFLRRVGTGSGGCEHDRLFQSVIMPQSLIPQAAYMSSQFYTSLREGASSNHSLCTNPVCFPQIAETFSCLPGVRRT